MCLNTALLIIFACAQCQDQFFMCVIPYAASVESQRELCLSLASSLFSSQLLSSFLLTFSLLLEEWQTWASLSARHFRTVSLGLPGVILGARTLWGSCKKIVGYLPKSEAVILLSYLPPLPLWLFPPTFHFPPASIFNASSTVPGVVNKHRKEEKVLNLSESPCWLGSIHTQFSWQCDLRQFKDVVYLFYCLLIYKSSSTFHLPWIIFTL